MNTLWHGRFADGPADELLAFTVSLPFDRRLARRRHRRLAGPRVGPGPGRASSTATRPPRSARRARPGRGGAGRGHASSSSRPTRTSTPRSSAASPSWPARPAASSTPAAAATTRWPPTCGCTPSGSLTARWPSSCSTCRRRCSTGPTDAGDAYLPGYTHLQRAQPVLLAHHLLAHGWALGRDVDRLLATRARADVSPARRRRAGRVVAAARPARSPPTTSASPASFENSLDAVSDRDFVAEALFDLALLGVHLSRIGEEVVLWSTEEFGFLKLARRLRTGSSMLPAEEEPRHRRAGPGQGRSADRPPHRPARDPEGPAARLQPRPPGGQGAAVRRGRPGAASPSPP